MPICPQSASSWLLPAHALLWDILSSNAREVGRDRQRPGCGLGATTPAAAFTYPDGVPYRPGCATWRLIFCELVSIADTAMRGQTPVLLRGTRAFDRGGRFSCVDFR
jgi:hypothetical protein